ncbi:uncharacterized protein LOC142579625 isoform X3 [Dermacentor variabilis]
MQATSLSAQTNARGIFDCRTQVRALIPAVLQCGLLRQTLLACSAVPHISGALQLQTATAAYATQACELQPSRREHLERVCTLRVYCMDCSSAAAFSPWSEQTAPTGNSSWDEDFNTSATAQVQQTLEAIDSYLYEEKDNLNDELKLECERWKQQFPYLRVIGKKLASPTATVAKSIINGGSTSTESKCDSEASWSAEDEVLKKNVIDHLCAIFWPEVQLWLDISHQHLDFDHLNLRHLHWDLDKEVHNSQQNLEGVLTVTPKLLRDRFSERACSSTFSSRSSTAQSMLRQGSRQQWSCDKQQRQYQPPVASRCTSRPRPLLPPLSSGSNGSSSSKVPLSSLSSRSERTSSGSSTAKLPPIDSA